MTGVERQCCVKTPHRCGVLGRAGEYLWESPRSRQCVCPDWTHSAASHLPCPPAAIPPPSSTQLQAHPKSLVDCPLHLSHTQSPPPCSHVPLGGGEGLIGRFGAGGGVLGQRGGLKWAGVGVRAHPITAQQTIYSSAWLGAKLSPKCARFSQHTGTMTPALTLHNYNTCAVIM